MMKYFNRKQLLNSLQYYNFYCIFVKINAALSWETFLKNILKILEIQFLYH